MTLEFNNVRAFVRVQVDAKFHQAKCNIL